MRKKGIQGVLNVAIVVAFLVLLVRIINVRVQISSKREEVIALTQEVERIDTANELQRTELNRGITEADLAEIARAELSYAQPGERIFVDTSSK